MERNLTVLSGSNIVISLLSVRRYFARSLALPVTLSITFLTPFNVLSSNCPDSIIFAGTPANSS